MELVKNTDPILKKKCQEFDFQNPQFEPIEFAKDLVKAMYDHGGLGLAANQVGIPYAIFALRGNPENFVCFNPKIIQPSEEEITLEENSMMFPGLIVKVKRPRHIRVRFNTPNGDVRTETFTGMTARVFQHMLDQINGVVYYLRANKYHRDQAMKEWKSK